MNEHGIRVGTKHYNIQKAQRLCATPEGVLYRKTRGSSDFFLYIATGKTNAEKYKDVSWADANSLMKTYGDRATHLKLFTTLGAETDPNKGGAVSVNLDNYHRIKAQRNAARLHLSVREYVCRLIDKDDSNNNYCR